MNYGKYYKSFGLNLTLKRILSNKIGGKFRSEYDEAIIKFIEKRVGLLKGDQLHLIPQKRDKKIIWAMWWQGESTMSNDVRKCCKSIETGKPSDYQYIMITKENYKQYIDLPDFIMRKLELGIITITHFSDIVRFYLLSTYGGLWIDATIYNNKREFKISFNERNFYTPRMEKNENVSSISKGRWMTPFWYSTGMDLYAPLIYSMLVEYWKNTDCMLDYFLVDYIIYYIYKNVKDFHEKIDGMPIDGEYFFELDKNMNEIYREEKYEQIMTLSTFHKINWKKQYMKKKSGKLTNYGHWLNGDANEFLNLVDQS